MSSHEYGTAIAQRLWGPDLRVRDARNCARHLVLENEQSVVVYVGPRATQHIADRALADGLSYAEGRRLGLILPERALRLARRRAAWLRTEVRFAKLTDGGRDAELCTDVGNDKPWYRTNEATDSSTTRTIVRDASEKALQHALASAPSLLGLTAPVVRELPIPVVGHRRRCFADLIGVDAHGDVSVIEVKVLHPSRGCDPLTVLQALDYWMWAHDRPAALVELLRGRGLDVPDRPRVRLGFVFGALDSAADIGPVVRASLDALSREIRWDAYNAFNWAHDGRLTISAWS